MKYQIAANSMQASDHHDRRPQVTSRRPPAQQQHSEGLYQRTKAALNDLEMEHFFAINGRLRGLSNRFVPRASSASPSITVVRNNPFGIDMSSDQIPSHLQQTSSVNRNLDQTLVTTNSPNKGHNPRSDRFFPILTPSHFCLRYSIRKIPFGGIDGTEAYPTQSDLTNGISVVKRFLQHRLRRNQERARILAVAKVLRPALCRYVLKRRLVIERLAKKWASADFAKSERDVSRRMSSMNGNNLVASPSSDQQLDRFLQLNRSMLSNLESSLVSVHGTPASSIVVAKTPLQPQHFLPVVSSHSPPSPPRTPNTNRSPSSFTLRRDTPPAASSSPTALHQLSPLANSSFSQIPGFEPRATHHRHQHQQQQQQLALDHDLRRVQSSLSVSMHTRRRIAAVWLREQLHFMIKARRSWKSRYAPVFQAAGEFCLYHFSSLLVLPEILKQLRVEPPPPIQIVAHAVASGSGGGGGSSGSQQNKRSSSAAPPRPLLTTFVVPAHELFPRLRQMQLEEVTKQEEEADKVVRDALAEASKAEMEKLKSNVANLRRKSISGVGVGVAIAMTDDERPQQSVPSTDQTGEGSAPSQHVASTNRDEVRERVRVFDLTETTGLPSSSNVAENDGRSSTINGTFPTPALPPPRALQHRHAATLVLGDVVKIPSHIFSGEDRKVSVAALPHFYRQYVESRRPNTGRGVDVLFDFSAVRRGRLQQQPQESSQAQMFRTASASKSTSTSPRAPIPGVQTAKQEHKSTAPKAAATLSVSSSGRRDESAIQFMLRSSRPDFVASPPSNCQDKKNNSSAGNNVDRIASARASFLPEIHIGQNISEIGCDELSRKTNLINSYYALTTAAMQKKYDSVMSKNKEHTQS